MQDGTATLEACGSPNEKGTRSFEDPHRAATVSEARRLIAMHAWRWLQEGRLVSLADLMRALALVPCSLAATMQVRCASCWKIFFFFFKRYNCCIRVFLFVYCVRECVYLVLLADLIPDARSGGRAL